jgi:hypothetical protein
MYGMWWCCDDLRIQVLDSLNGGPHCLHVQVLNSLKASDISFSVAQLTVGHYCHQSI